MLYFGNTTQTKEQATDQCIRVVSDVIRACSSKGTSFSSFGDMVVTLSQC